MIIYYFGMKIMLLMSLVRSIVKFEPLQKHFLFLGVLYASLIAFLSFVFLQDWVQSLGWVAWGRWIGVTLLLATTYFWLIGKYDEGLLSWIVILVGVVGLIYY